MEIVKYNRGKTGYTIGSQSSINASKSSDSTTTTTSTTIDANLWGNPFDGTADIDDTMFCSGSVYVIPTMFGEDDDEDDDTEGELEEFVPKEYDRFEDDEGGNIYAENKIKSFGDIEAVNDISVGKNIEAGNDINCGKNIEAGNSVYAPELYLNFPDSSGNKTNILELFNYIMPKGSIIMHNGSVSAEELNSYGWAVCDGSNGTPDLRGKFVRSSGNGLNVGDTGGSATKSLSVNELPAHNHSISGLSVAYTQRTYSLTNPDTKTVGVGVDGEATTTITSYQNLSSGSSTTGAYISGNDTDSEGDSEEFSILPPYYCLIYIMRVG